MVTTMMMLRFWFVTALVVGESMALVFDAQSEEHGSLPDGTGGTRRFGADDDVFSDVPSDMPSDVPSYAPSLAEEDDDNNPPSSFPSLVLITPPPMAAPDQQQADSKATIHCVAGNSVRLTDLTRLPVQIVVSGAGDCRSTTDGTLLPLTTSTWTSNADDGVVQFHNVSDLVTTAIVSEFGTWSVCLDLVCGSSSLQTASCCTEIFLDGVLSEQGNDNGPDTKVPTGLLDTRAPTLRPTMAPSKAPVAVATSSQPSTPDQDDPVTNSRVDFVGQQEQKPQPHGRAVESPTLSPNTDYQLIRGGGGGSSDVTHETKPIPSHNDTEGATEQAPLPEQYARLPPQDGASVPSPPDRSGLVDSNHEANAPISEQGEGQGQAGGQSSESKAPVGYRYARFLPKPVQGEDANDQALPQPDPQTGLRYAGLVHNDSSAGKSGSQPDKGGNAQPPKTESQTGLRYSRLRSQGKAPPDKKRPNESAVDKPEHYIRSVDASS